MFWFWVVVAATMATVAVVAALFRLVFVPWSTTWGATAAECAAARTGDDWCSADEFRPTKAVRATRAVTIAAPPEVVWSWLAQIGRGGGYYAVDRLDNGGKPSARHLISWVTPPRLGDATAIGYLRGLTPGRELAWWMPSDRLPGGVARMGITYALLPVEPVADAGAPGTPPRGTPPRTRLVARVNGDGRGWAWPLVLAVFVVIDFVMMRRQLLGVRERAERFGARTEDPERPETGARDQFQLYEFVGADGARAGVPGKEKAARWHDSAADALGDRMGAPSS